MADHASLLGQPISAMLLTTKYQNNCGSNTAWTGAIKAYLQLSVLENQCEVLPRSSLALNDACLCWCKVQGEIADSSTKLVSASMLHCCYRDMVHKRSGKHHVD